MKSNGYGSSSSLEDKLNKGNCTLENILDEEDVIQELKYQNQKLINLYIKYLNINLVLLRILLVSY